MRPSAVLVNATTFHSLWALFIPNRIRILVTLSYPSYLINSTSHHSPLERFSLQVQKTNRIISKSKTRSRSHFVTWHNPSACCSVRKIVAVVELHFCTLHYLRFVLGRFKYNMIVNVSFSPDNFDYTRNRENKVQCINNKHFVSR